MRIPSTLSLLLGLAARLGAQDATESKPWEFGGFSHQGSVTAGYRFTDVSGYRPRYQELFNLNGGPRLLDISLSGGAGEKTRFADRYSFNVSGLGGDPFTTAQFQVGKKQRYDLRVHFRKSTYYWNRDDQALLPNGLHALTSNHDWATVRKLASASLLVHASRDLKFSFEFYRNTRSGISGTTRPVDYFGSSSAWGSFARANPYYLFAPLDESANRATGGVDYTRRGWALHYRLGYQRFSDSVAGVNPQSPQRSINVDDANTARELLTRFAWSDSRRLHTPVSEFSYSGRLGTRVETRGGYIFYRYSGPSSLNMAMDGTGRTTSATVTAAYSIALASQAHVTEPNHVVDQGFSFRVTDWWRILLDYRFTRFTVDADASFRTVNNGAVTAGEALSEWKVSAQTVDLNSVFTPAVSLLIRAGVRLMKNDIVAADDGVTDPQRTRRVKSVWPIASLYYQPHKVLSIRADVEHINNGTSYTRITPHIDTGARFVIRIRPTDKLYFDETAIVRNRELLQTDFRSTVRSNAFSANYDVDPRLSLFAGFSYDSLFAANYVNFLRGTAPFTNVALRDQTVQRLWHGGVRAMPVPRLGFSFAGNFLRVTGVGEIAGEAPLYGPASFPFASASGWYDVPRFGRLTLQLQRAYYTEEIVPGNNVGANILMVAWTRSF